jgi:hypothetical protein
MIKTVRYSAFLVLVCTLFFTCRKKDKDDECPACPSVESISPTSAKCYEKITIFGKNFAAKPSDNIIKINGMRVSADSVISGTTSQLVVRVPRGCGTGPVTVDIDNELTNFGNPPTFTYNFRYLISDYGAYFVKTNPPACIGGTSATMSNYIDPAGIVSDASNNIYFADRSLHCIYKLDGNNNRDSCLFAGNPGQEGNTDGLGMQASFRYPGQMFIDNNNTIYVAENSTSIRTISPSGNVSTYITDTNLNYSTGIAFQPGNANIAYVSVLGDHIISKITRQGTKLVTTIFAGGKGQGGYVDAVGTTARFLDPQAVVVDNSGNVFVSDRNNVIRKITPAGLVTTFAGNGTPNFADGLGTQASFNQPQGMFMDTDNTIYVADTKNNCIRKITPGGLVSTIYTFTASMNTPSPNGVTRDRNGNYYITYRSGIGNGIKKLSIF